MSSTFDYTDIQPSPCIFSIELQFLVLLAGHGARGLSLHEPEFDPKDGQAPVAWHQEARNQIAHLLREMNIWAHASNFSADQPEDTIDPALQAKIDAFRKEHPDPKSLSYYQNGIWVVRPAPSLQVPKDMIRESHHWSSVSIKSPLLSTDDDCAAMIHYVLDFLKATFYIGTHSSARVKVSVKQPGVDFSVEHVRKLVKLLWLASPLLDTIHPKHCQAGSAFAPGLPLTGLFNPYTYSLLEELQLDENTQLELFDKGKAYERKTSPMFCVPIDPNGPLSSRSRVSLLELDTCDLQQLVRKLSVKWTTVGGGKTMDLLSVAYNFRELVNEDPDHRVIGFSQHTGTLDWEAVRHWVTLCLKLVEMPLRPEKGFDRVLDKLGFSDFVASTVNSGVKGRTPEPSPSLSLADFLQSIGCHQPTIDHLKACPEACCPELSKMFSARPALDFERREDLYTFGVEIEAIVPVGFSADDDPMPSDARWYLKTKDYTPKAFINSSGKVENGIFDRLGLLVKEFQRLLGLENYLSFSSQSWDLGLTSTQLQGAWHETALKHGVFLSEDHSTEYQGFHLHGDISVSSLRGRPVMGYLDGCQGIEMSSPITPFTENGIRHLTGAVSLLRREIRLILDPSCSVHCHVGNAKNIWTLLDVKKIVTLVWFCEPLILSVIHPLRHKGEYSRPITTSATMTDLDPEESKRTRAFTLHIPLERLSEEEVNSLAALWNGNDGGAFSSLLLHKDWAGKVALHTKFRDVSLANPKINSREVSGTFEFRYLQGCMNNELIVQYVRLCVAIVKFAHTSKRQKYRSLLEQLIENRGRIGDPSSSVVSMLLTEIGLPDAQSFWTSQAGKMERSSQSMDSIHDWLHPWAPEEMMRKPEGIDINFNVLAQFVHAESIEESRALNALLKTMFPPRDVQI